MEIKCSLNFTWEGKPRKDEATGRMMYGDTVVSISHNWTNVVEDVDKIMSYVMTKGIAIAPYLDPAANGHRTGVNFESHQIAMIDIDDGMSINQLVMDDELYNLCGYGFYTTASHTPRHHRFRVIYVLEEPIYNPTDMVRLYNGLMRHYKSADKACKDSVRLFYGSIDPKVWEVRPVDNVMPKELVTAFINSGLRQEQEEAERIKAIMKKKEQMGWSDHEPTNAEKEAAMYALSKMSHCHYEVWREVGWAMYHSGFTFNQFFSLTTTVLKATKRANDCQAIWKDAPKYHRTFGALINILKQHNVYSVYAVALKENKSYNPMNAEELMWMKLKQEQERTRIIVENMRRRAA